MTFSDTTTKRCPKCATEYPATREYFCRDKSRVGGLQVYCKTCNRANVRKQAQKNGQTRHLFDPKQLKRCSGCKDWFPATPEFFTRDKSRSDGLCHYCIPCHRLLFKEVHKRYRQTHREQIRVSCWLYAQENPIKIKQKRRRHYLKHRQRLLQKSKKYRLMKAKAVK